MEAVIYCFSLLMILVSFCQLKFLVWVLCVSPETSYQIMSMKMATVVAKYDEWSVVNCVYVPLFNVEQVSWDHAISRGTCFFLRALWFPYLKAVNFAKL